MGRALIDLAGKIPWQVNSSAQSIDGEAPRFSSTDLKFHAVCTQTTAEQRLHGFRLAKNGLDSLGYLSIRWENRPQDSFLIF
jgi:hypothetical protein